MKKFILLLLFSFSAFGYLTPGTGSGGGSGNIVSINGDTTAAQLISGGTGITTATVAGNTTVTATGGGGVTTVGTFGSTPNANAGSISGTTLTFQPADATHPGSMTTAAQSFAGAKTFSTNLLCATNGGCALGAAATKFSSGFFGTAVQYGLTSTIDGTVDGAGTLDIRNATTGTTTAGMGHIGLIKVSGADNNMPSLKLFSHSGYATNLIWPGGPNSSGSIGDFGFDNTYNANSAPRYIAVSHDIIWDTDGAGDIGQAGAFRPATIRALTNINLASLTASLPVQSDGSKNLVSAAINLSGSQVTGNLPVTKLNSGTSASSSTFWRGDGTWAAAGTNTTFTSVSSNVTLACNSYNFVSTAAARSLTFPAPTSGCIINVKDVTGTASTNNISLLRNASEQIEGVAATFVYATNYGAVQFVADGTNWWAF